jgi:hypothetical protein
VEGSLLGRRRISGKTVGWKQEQQRVFKDLKRIPGWRREISGKIPLCQKVNKQIKKTCKNSETGERE